MTPRPLYLFLAASMLLGCGGDSGNGGPHGPFTPPDARGDFQAGWRDLIATSGAGIELPVDLWYPVSAGVEATVAYDSFGITKGSAVVGGAADCTEPRPVVLFSHGNGGIGFQSFTLTQHLARHGYVVVAPDHVHNTFMDMDEDLQPELFLRRPLDIAGSYDWLVAWAAEPGSPLHGCVDPAAGYAVAGHSFGGFTSLAVSGAPLDIEALVGGCEGDERTGCDTIRAWAADHPDAPTSDRSDPRVWASVPIAPAWYEFLGQGLARIPVPTLVIGADRDDDTPWDSTVLPAYQGLTARPRYLARFADAGHYSFTEMCTLLGSTYNGCGDDMQPPEQVLPLLGTLTLALLEVVRGEHRAREWLPPQGGIDLWESVE